MTEDSDKQEIYCQTCDRDLTGQDLVLTGKSVVCIDYSGNPWGAGGTCLDKNPHGKSLNEIFLDTYSPNWPEGPRKIIRDAIEQKILTNYGPLRERSV